MPTIVDKYELERYVLERDTIPGLNTARGIPSNLQVVSKFGANNAVGTTFVPVAAGGVYQTPTSATSLEIVSGDAADGAAGAGARKVSVIGLDENWAEVTQEITMNGTTAVAIPTDLLRLYRLYVTESGAYATSTAGSHVGALTVRVAGAGATWAQISATDFPRGQSQIACYTVPAEKTAYVSSIHGFVDATKAVDLLFLGRPNADDVSTPFSGALRTVSEWTGITGKEDRIPPLPLGPFVAKTDMIFLAKVGVGSGSISVDFDMILVDD